MVSPACSGNRLTIGMPFAVRSRSGMSAARNLYTRPLFEKNKRYACAVVKITRRTRSSSFSVAPLTPRPPRACARNAVAGTAFTYWACVITMTNSLSSTRSSSAISPESLMILQTRSVANFSRISDISSLMTVRNFGSDARIASYSLMRSCTSPSSFSRSIRDKRVS